MTDPDPARNARAPLANATVEQLVVVAAAFWTLSASSPFLSAAIAGRSFAEPATWGFCVALLAMVMSLHVVLLGLVATRRTVRPLIAVLSVTAAVAAHHAVAYRTVVDPSMMRNVLRTDLVEARELLTAGLALNVAVFAGLPITLLWGTRVSRRRPGESLRARARLLAIATAVGCGALFASFQPFASLMRNRPELRYLIAPANVLWSSARVLADDAREVRAAREPIGIDARPGASWTGTVASTAPAGACTEGRCLDEWLLHDLDARLDAARGTQLWVLHPIGNHGPSYFRRYPPGFARFLPDCRSDDLRRCDRAEIVNAYDNALLYTDHVLATLIERLTSRADRVDAAMLYVSDHGESLGEGGLYLHGVPYAIAPDVQTRVPMVAWVGDGFARRIGLDMDCLARRAAAPTGHRNLFHTLLGLLDVSTALHDPALDLSANCRAAAHASTSR